MKAEDTGNSPEPVDELYMQACRESRESLKAYGLDLDRMEAQARRTPKTRGKAGKRRLAWRWVLIAVSALLLINAFLFTLDLPWAKTYQFQLRRWVYQLAGKTSSQQDTLTLCSTTDIEEAQKNVPFHFPVPQWLPYGYTLNNVTVDTDEVGNINISQKYIKSDDFFRVYISNETQFAKTVPSPKEAKYEKADIGTQQVFVRFYQVENTTWTSCHFINNEGLHVLVTGTLDRQSLFKLVESLT